MRRILLTLALSSVAAAPAAAQKLTLEFKDGTVTLDAAAVPVRTILSEWAKLGGTRVIGGDRVAGAPLTVKLEAVPEAKALEVVLRNVAGYMVAPRSTGAGASIYDRILVMATSSAPAPAAAAAARPGPQNNGMAGTQRFVPPRREAQPADEDAQEEEEDPNPPNPPVFTFPQAQPGMLQPGMAQPPMQQPFGGQPGAQMNPGAAQQPPMIINPASGATPGYQTVTPFGSSTPGVIIAPPPTPTQPTTPPTMIRPPGGGR